MENRGWELLKITEGKSSVLPTPYFLKMSRVGSFSQRKLKQLNLIRKYLLRSSVVLACVSNI